MNADSTMQPMDFSGKNVLITGAIGNLGMACAELYQRLGAQLALVDRSDDRLTKYYGAWTPRPLLLTGIDLGDSASVDRCVKRVRAEYGAPHVLVHTVGAFRGGKASHAPAGDDWEFLHKVNVGTALNLVRGFVPGMIEQGYGRIVFVGARAALHASANYAAYAASKASLLRLTEALAEELMGQGITVNAVLPGTIDTPQNRSAMPDADFSGWVQPHAIAHAIAFLSTEAARDTTGFALPVYGRG